MNILKKSAAYVFLVDSPDCGTRGQLAKASGYWCTCSLSHACFLSALTLAVALPPLEVSVALSSNLVLIFRCPFLWLRADPTLRMEEMLTLT